MELIGNLNHTGLKITIILLIPGILLAAFLAAKAAFKIDKNEGEISIIGITWLVLTFLFSYLAFVIISLLVTWFQSLFA